MTTPTAATEHRLIRAYRMVPFALTLGCAGLLAWCAIFGEPFNVSGEDGLLEWGTVFFFLLAAGRMEAATAGT